MSELDDSKQIFFVRRPIVAIVIALFMVIVGGVSILGLAIEQYPDITPPVVRVSTAFTGANAISVEQSVASPLEQEINGVENMLYMKSTNANDGTLALEVTFDLGTDPDMNTVFTQTRAAAATPKLPEEVKRLGVKTEKSMPNILMLLTLTSDGAYDQEFLGNYGIINVKDQLARTRGIGRVQVLGASDYSMRIWVKPDRLAKLGITIPEIVDAVRQQNVIAPGGKFGAEPAPPGTEFTYTVRLPDRLISEEEFGNVVIRSESDGSQIFIKDVARVELGVESYNAFTRLNQKDCAIIALYQAPGSNAVELSSVVRETMDELAKDFPEGISYEVSLDSTAPIKAGISEIIETLIIALLLVVLVVFIFIQDWRATLIPTLAIPVSLIAAFMVFPVLGFSINTLSLLGLVLAIGIVVDDAIVVVEAVQVNMQKGMNPKTATSEAMKEVTAPIIATTLVMVAVFVPVAAMAGITGKLYQQFAITIAVSVVFSSINALTLSPALCSLLLKNSTGPGKGLLGRFFTKFNTSFDKSTESYYGMAKVMAGKLKRGSIYIVLTLVAAGIFGAMVPGGFLPEEDQGYLYVNVQLPNAASMQRTDAVMKKIEAIVMAQPETEFATALSGFSLLAGSYIPNTGFMFVTLKEWDEREATAKEMMERLNAIFAREIQEAQVFSFGPPAIPGLGNGSGFSIMIQDKKGQDPTYLAQNTYAFIQAAQARPEIASAFTTYQATVPQRFMEINQDKILKTGVRLGDVYNTFAAYLGGAYINDFNRFGRLYKAYVQAEPEYRQSENGLDLFYVKNNVGEPVPISSFVNVKRIAGPDYTNRFNLFRAAEVTGSPAAGYSSAQALDALEEVAAEVLPDDMTYSWNAMSYQEKSSSGQIGIIFSFSLLFVFLILAAQYESWSMPFAILLGTPFALFGAFLFLYLARLMDEAYLNNIFAQISLVMLIAMAAKNAILIVEFANIKFDEGLSLFDAAVEAAKLRFRPILMTVFSFILGVLPLILASGSGAEARKVMGMALLGGIGVATLLGLFLYPMLFVLVGKLGRYEEKREAVLKVQKS
ncbi:efflux RND transporter permease subunit [Algoriphagus sp.]|uniref:efflux RND transporter permease subunit n=3 Tax=Algoriphagus sp. TaxID=1872435 RepID=UPI003291D39C